MSPKDRADYFSQRRDALKMVSVMIERDALDELDAVLRAEGETRSSWIRQAIYDKIGYQKKSALDSINKLRVRCPRCGREAASPGEIDRLFGWRTVNGSLMPQSWCAQCRAGGASKEKGGVIMPNTIHAKCPQCEKEAHGKDKIDELFGWRVVNGKTVPQSWCRECRSKHLEKK